MMGFVVAVPIDPLGLCASIERCGWVPGMDFFPAWCRYADALAGGIAAMSISLVSQFLVNHQDVSPAFGKAERRTTH